MDCCGRCWAAAGASFGLQEEAGVCDLPRAGAPWRPEAAGSKGHRVREACEPGCPQTEEHDEPETGGRGTRRQKRVQQPAGAEQLLGWTGRRLQVL